MYNKRTSNVQQRKSAPESFPLKHFFFGKYPLTEVCGSFRTALPKLKNIYYKDTKEKYQMISS